MAEPIEKIDMTGVTVVKAGATAPATITDIQQGTQGEFRNDEYWVSAGLNKAQTAEAKQKAAIEITTSNGASLVINLPNKGADGKASLHPKTLLAQFVAKYGKAPEKDMEVQTQIDAQGFWRVLL